MQLYGDLADDYRDFAGYACDDSPCFEDWALAVADDEEVQAWLTELPPVKRQPNLVFAAARWHGVEAPGPYADLRAALLGDNGTIRDTILSRSTQTNEVGRLATLMPALGLLGNLLEGPLSLLEVGASAGLCLYPDRYDYRWTGGALVGSGGPTLRCVTVGDLPVPSRHPDVAWRGGIDLNPLDVGDEAQMAWLTNLVWPEQDDRRARLRSAIAVARADPPFLVRGDLVERLPAVLDEARRHGTPVVFHSAVIAYLEPDDRQRFHRQMRDLVDDGACHWISNEGKHVLPEITATGPAAPEDNQAFVLAIDGRAVAWTHGHGASMTWL
jgi:hypothetical protein